MFRQLVSFWSFFLATLASAGDVQLSDQTRPDQRLQYMKQYINPSPGTRVAVNPSARHNLNVKDPNFMRGFIDIVPPKGVCFTVTRHLELADERICAPTSLSYRVGDINPAGEIVWHISTGEGDHRYRYSWPTPHRLLQTIKSSDGPSNEVKVEPMLGCYVEHSEASRVIRLSLMNGSRWAIRLPGKDRLVKQPKRDENLYIQKGVVGGIQTDAQNLSDADTFSVEKKGDPKVHEGQRARYIPDSLRKFRAKYLKRKLGSDNPFDPPYFYWAMPDRGSYLLKGENFIESDLAPKSKGQCLYQYRGAPRDPGSGWMECHEVGLYDVVLMHLPCLSELEPLK